MTPVQFELATLTVYDTLTNEEHLDPVDLAQKVVQELVDSGLFPSNHKKLKPSQVREMRAAHKRGTSQRSLAAQFGVNSATVSRIVRGQYW